MQILRVKGLYPAELWPETCLGETTIFWDNYSEMIVEENGSHWSVSDRRAAGLVTRTNETNEFRIFIFFLFPKFWNNYLEMIVP